jgi:hypothetical protein
MKKVLALFLAGLMLVLVPVEFASARGGGRWLKGVSGGRGSRKDAEKLRERTRREDADALLRDAAANRRGS